MIHRALKVIRQFHAMTQTDLSVKLGISKSYLSEIEAGKKSVGYELLEKYSAIFEMPVSSLVFFSENIERKDSVSEKFRTVFSDKILRVMEWAVEKDEPKAI